MGKMEKKDFLNGKNLSLIVSGLFFLVALILLMFNVSLAAVYILLMLGISALIFGVLPYVFSVDLTA
jgi:uncharacterized membrane protein HdeD (DUF308 family)